MEVEKTVPVVKKEIGLKYFTYLQTNHEYVIHQRTHLFSRTARLPRNEDEPPDSPPGGSAELLHARPRALRAASPQQIRTSSTLSQTIAIISKMYKNSKIYNCNYARVSFKEIDLTRKLSESYDMQEKLAADNADLEVKRFLELVSTVIIRIQEDLI